MSRHRKLSRNKFVTRIAQGPQGPVIVRMSRNPYESFIMVAMIVGSWSTTLFHSDTLFPHPMQLGMCVVVSIGALVSLVGSLHRDEILGAFIEIAGQFGVIGPLILYSLNLIRERLQEPENPSLFGGTVVVAILLAACWRVLQIFLWIRRRVNTTDET